MNKNTLRWYANQELNILIPEEKILSLAKKEFKIIDNLSNRITNYWKYKQTVIISFYTKIDNIKIKHFQWVTITKGDNGYRIHQLPFVKIINDCLFTSSQTFGSMHPRWNPKFSEYNGLYNNYLWNSSDYEIKKPYLSICNNTIKNKYHKPVIEKLRSLFILFDEITPLMETAYKEGWLWVLCKYGDVSARKPITAFKDYFKSNEKEHFYKWLKAFGKTKNFNFSIWKDYVAMCKRKGLDDFYNKNYKKIHDQWNIEIAKIKEEKIKKIKAKYVKTFKNKDKQISLYKPKTKKYLIKLGEELSICVGTSDYKPKDIWVAIIDGCKVCIEYVNNKFKQIKSYNNMNVPIRIQKQIKELIIKEVSNGTTI